MKLKSFNYFNCLLIIFFYFTPLLSEEKIDIWNNKNKKQEIEKKEALQKKEDKQKLNLDSIKTIELNQNIKIEDSSLVEDSQEGRIFGIYDPEENDFNLNMWSTTKAEDVKTNLKRIEKIQLSNTANQILEKILLSFSYPPQGMNEDEFVDLKINWLIKNQRSDLIESFLKQNNNFKSKSRAVQYIVDENIANGNIKEGCKKIEFIDKQIRDSYL